MWDVLPSQPSRFLTLVYALVVVGAAPCGDEAACQARMQTIVERLSSSQDVMKKGKVTMNAIEDFRENIVRGKRIPLPSPHRQHLERGSPLVGDVSYDAKHKPLSTNASKHLRFARTLASSSRIRFHGLMPVKRPATPGKPDGGPTALVVTISDDSKLSLFTLDGECRLNGFDLGHQVSHFSLSPSMEQNFVLTGDASGELRLHSISLSMKNVSSAEDGVAAESKDEEGKDTKKRQQKKLHASANTTAHFSVFEPGDGRTLTAVVSVDRGSQPMFLAADSLGSIAVFFKNGTSKGRIKVTEDHGGVRGLLRGQGQTVLFYSSHSFGFFSASQVEVTTTPCTGWNSPIFDVAADPSSSYSRVVLGLSDGDVLVFQTVSGKNKDKTCDLTSKFPRVSPIPFRLHVVRGHVMGLPSPLEETKRPEEYNRELFFFNLAAMEAGFGDTESRSVTLQASFGSRRLESYSLLSQSGGSSSGGAKMHLVLRFLDSPSSLELYDLTLKTPSAGSGGGGSSGSGGGDGGDWSSWLDWIPKVGVFGITLVGVVIWNVRKVAGKKSSSASAFADGEHEELIKQLQSRKREMKMKENLERDAAKESVDSLDEKMASLLERTKDLKKDMGGLGAGFGDLGGMEDDDD